MKFKKIDYSSEITVFYDCNVSGTYAVATTYYDDGSDRLVAVTGRLPEDKYLVPFPLLRLYIYRFCHAILPWYKKLEWHRTNTSGVYMAKFSSSKKSIKIK